MIHSIKGTQDILPNRTPYWRKLEDIIRSIMSIYGYDEIRTPAFEKTELFSRGVGEETDIVTKEMYSWTDQGGTHLTLKPELTAPVVRAYIQHNLGANSPINKLYYIDALYRRERPQKGRYRQFHQFGAEAFGSEHPELDVEIISLAWETLKALGIENITLKLNSIGSPECRRNYRETIKSFLRPSLKELSETSQHRFETNPLRILDTKVPHEIELLKNAPSIQDAFTAQDKDHFSTVCEMLESIHIPFQLDFRLVRGLDYYTRTTFEITSDALGAQNSLCGGGRYDDLVKTLGGKPTPGIGFAAGIERILLAANLSNLSSDEKPQVFFIILGEKARKDSIRYIQTLRRKGIRVVFDPLRRSLKAQMREANKTGAAYAVIIGDNEIESQTVQVKDLQKSTQSLISLKSLEEQLAALLIN